MNGAVLSGVDNVFVFRFPIVVRKEVLVNDSVDVSVAWGFGRGAGEAEFVPFRVNREGAEEFLGLIEGFFDRKGPINPIDRGVDFFQPE